MNPKLKKQIDNLEDRNRLIDGNPFYYDKIHPIKGRFVTKKEGPTKSGKPTSISELEEIAKRYPKSKDFKRRLDKFRKDPKYYIDPNTTTELEDRPSYIGRMEDVFEHKNTYRDYGKTGENMNNLEMHYSDSALFTSKKTKAFNGRLTDKTPAAIFEAKKSKILEIIRSLEALVSTPTSEEDLAKVDWQDCRFLDQVGQMLEDINLRLGEE